MTGYMNSQNNEPPIEHGSHWMATLFASWLNPRDIAMLSNNSDWPRWVVGRAALTILLMSMISVVVRTSCGCFLNLSIAGPLGIVGIYQLVHHRLLSIAILLTAWILLGFVLSCVISMMSGGMRSWLQIFACGMLAIAASSPCLCIPILGDEVMAVVGGILGCRLVWHIADHAVARISAVVSFMFILGVLLLLPNMPTTTNNLNMPQVSAARTEQADARTVAQTLFYFRAQKGRWPDNALEMTISPLYFVPEYFFHECRDNMQDDEIIHGLSLHEYGKLQESEKRSLVREIAANDNVSGIHQVGDIIFTYYGIEPNNKVNDLWLLVVIRPGSLQECDAGIIAVDTDLEVLEFKQNEVHDAMAMQNDLRARNGLKPIDTLLMNVSGGNGD